MSAFSTSETREPNAADRLGRPADHVEDLVPLPLDGREHRRRCGSAGPTRARSRTAAATASCTEASAALAAARRHRECNQHDSSSSRLQREPRPEPRDRRRSRPIVRVRAGARDRNGQTWAGSSSPASPSWRCRPRHSAATAQPRMTKNIRLRTVSTASIAGCAHQQRVVQVRVDHLRERGGDQRPGSPGVRKPRPW